jgi:hypothetical protein
MVVVLAAVLMSSTTALAGTVTLSVPNVEAQPGQEVEVAVAVKGAKGMRAFQLVLTYDPAVLEVVKDADASRAVTRGKILPENSLLNVYTTSIPPPVGSDGKSSGEPTAVKPGRIPVLFLGAGDASKKTIQALEDDGTLLTIRFRVVGQPGVKSPLALERAEAFQGDGLSMLVKTEPGELTVVSGSAFQTWWLLLLIPVALLFLLLALMMRRKRSPGRGEPELVALPLDSSARHTCVKCKRVITIPPSMAGQPFKCPACGTAQMASG